MPQLKACRRFDYHCGLDKNWILMQPSGAFSLPAVVWQQDVNADPFADHAPYANSTEPEKVSPGLTWLNHLFSVQQEPVIQISMLPGLSEEVRR